MSLVRESCSSGCSVNKDIKEECGIQRGWYYIIQRVSEECDGGGENRTGKALEGREGTRRQGLRGKGNKQTKRKMQGGEEEKRGEERRGEERRGDQ